MNKLDEAKLNLKNTLNRLESIVESKLKKIDQITVDQEIIDKISHLEQKNTLLLEELKEKKDEINYLREQNHELQAAIGVERERNFKLKKKNDDAAQKVDEIIGEVRSFLLIN